METKKIYRFYVDNKLKASCGKNRKEEVFNDLSQKYGIEKVFVKEEQFKIDEALQSLINKIKGDLIMGLSIENLKICFKNAKINNFKYVGIKVWMADFEKCEVIINPIENFDKKLEYYQNAYNDDLTLKNAPDKIKIVGFTYGNSYEDIEDDLGDLKIIF